MKIVKYVQQGTLDIRLSGKFTFSDHEGFRDVLEQIGHQDTKQVVMHLQEVEFVDSAAMGMLLLAREEAAKHVKALSLVGANGQVKRMFDMASFQNFFTLR
jgi:HptB-dependent secretion and biofilm anti anti-sigma factor